jgi:hypothetical protein
MNLKKTAMLVVMGMSALAAPIAFGADGDGMQSFQREVKTMANKDGMVSKKDFMAMMEKKWNAMDKGNKGMLSTADVMRIFSETKGQ